MKTALELKDDFLAKATQKRVYEIDYCDIEDLISLHFTGETGNYDIVDENEWRNDSSYDFQVRRSRKPYIDDKTSWTTFTTEGLLNQMCNDGAIPQCNLYITVCW